MAKSQQEFLEKVLKVRILLLVIVLLFVFLVVAFLFALDAGDQNAEKQKDQIYKTWKVIRYYKNGKLVLNDEKFKDASFQVGKDSNSAWYYSNYSMPIKVWISNDGKSLYSQLGEQDEVVENIYELTSTRLRFGKRTVAAHYEFVLEPAH
ncbi:MAG: hypothetical protein U0U66_09270 [Cytophagaceae bacterium]